jgi:type VI secretion system protein ImpH
MASPIRTENTDVALEEVRKKLFAEPYTFDFFQAVRLLERLSPERSPIGRYANPQEEVVRIAANPSINFPASQIQELAPQKDHAPRMSINFMGLTGPLGALPTHLTELVANRARAHDTTMRDFFDLFSHRMTSFFYQAWEKGHFPIAYERDQDDPVTNCLYALVGLGTEGLRARQAVKDELFIFFSGLFGLAPRSAVAIEAILSNFFNVNVEVEPFIGAWRELEERDQCVIGDESEDAASLGFGVVAGNEVWDQQSRVRLKFGPLSAERYRDFLPSGSEWAALKAIVRTYCGNDLEVEVQLILKREEVPACELGKADVAGPQLGWYTWMKAKPQFDRDPDDTVLLLLEA